MKRRGHIKRLEKERGASSYGQIIHRTVREAEVGDSETISTSTTNRGQPIGGSALELKPDSQTTTAHQRTPEVMSYLLSLVTNVA